jgi:uncharacterized LabA/DUF88 family protein
MLALIRNIFKKEVPIKRIAYLDGDQGITEVVNAYHKYLHNTETHLVRVGCAPKALRHEKGFNKIYLQGYRKGKEVTDKFIGASIQKAVTDGYKEITVVSGDYDFIDIFKMAIQINPSITDVTFRMIVPSNHQNSKDHTVQNSSIQIIKMH